MNETKSFLTLVLIPLKNYVVNVYKMTESQGEPLCRVCAMP